MSSIYHFHIPKTAGRYIQNSLIFSLNIACKRNDINTRNTLITSHSGWGLVNEDQYVFTFIREPVRRTISHVMFYNPFFRQETIEETKQVVMDYLKSEETEFLHNYQSKFITSIDIDMENKFHKTFDYNLSLLEERLARFNKVIKSENINDQTLADIYNECCFKLGMSHEIVDKVPYSVPDTIYFNDISGQVLESLTEEEKLYIESLNEVDIRLYNSI